MKRSYLTLSVLAVMASLGGTFASTPCLAQNKHSEILAHTKHNEIKAEAAQILAKAPAEAVAKVKRLGEIKERLGEGFEVKVFKENGTHLKLVAEVRGEVTVRDVVEKLKGGETEVFADIAIRLTGTVDEGKKTEFIKEIADVGIKMVEDSAKPGTFVLYNCGPDKRNALAEIAAERAYANVHFLVDGLEVSVNVGGAVLAKVGQNGTVSVKDLVDASVRIRRE